MNDLIRKKDAIDAIEGITSGMSICVNSDECHGMKRMQRQAVLEIANMPSAEQERKKGKWINQDEGSFYPFSCSNCHKEPLLDAYGNYVFSNYCSNCGADMREIDGKTESN